MLQVFSVPLYLLNKDSINSKGIQMNIQKNKNQSAMTSLPTSSIKGLTPGNKNTMTGVRASDNYHKNLFDNYAKEALGKTKTKKLRKLSPDLDTGFKPLFKNLKFSKNALMGGKTMTENAIYLIEKLIEETYTQRTSRNGITPAGPPLTGPKGVEPATSQHNQLLSSYKTSVQAKVDDTMQRNNNARNAAADVGPGTEIPAYGKTAGITKTAMGNEARYNAADNHRRSLDMREQQQEG